jgi:hypothetical protein
VAHRPAYECGHYDIGYWGPQHRTSFLRQKFVSCAGRVKAIEDTLTNMTVKTFWQGTDPQEMTEEEISLGLQHLEDSKDLTLNEKDNISELGAPANLLRVQKVSTMM